MRMSEKCRNNNNNNNTNSDNPMISRRTDGGNKCVEMEKMRINEKKKEAFLLAIHKPM